MYTSLSLYIYIYTYIYDGHAVAVVQDVEGGTQLVGLLGEYMLQMITYAQTYLYIYIHIIIHKLVS